MKLRRSLGKLTPFQYLSLGYAVIVLLGAMLLSLPISSTTGRAYRYLDSLFMASSGISTTGLVIVDPGSGYTLFGQAILLAIFQIGGIGYMTFVIFFSMLFRLRNSVRTLQIAHESLAGAEMHELGRFFIVVLAFTLGIEASGAVLLWLRWHGMPGRSSFYYALFHSISAFCTAGFSLFPDGLMRDRNDVIVNLTIIVVSLLGGIGFTVLSELSYRLRSRLRGRRPRRLSLHARMALTVTAVLIICSAVVVLLSERWDPSSSTGQRAMASVFQAVSASTTDGFNTLDIGSMSATAITVFLLLMFIGASPGSTGGGVKTTTVGLLACWLAGQLRGRSDRVQAFHREIAPSSFPKAAAVVVWFGVAIAADLLVLSFTEHTSYDKLLFEIFSALGNTGLSMGITSSLSDVGRLLLLLTMYIGRVGPLAIAQSLAGRVHHDLFRFPQESLHVG